MKTADELVKAYLSDLKNALKGADRATIQDALADAEEHLRTALENASLKQRLKPKPSRPSSRITANQPRSLKPTRPGKAPCHQPWPPHRLLAGSRAGSSAKSYPGFFGVFADPRAWGGLVYMLISLVTGTLYFSWAVTGLSTSIGIMILIIGIPITIIFLLSFRGIAFLEGRLVEALLGERMPRRASFTDSSLPWRERLKILLTGKATWLSIIYMILMLPIGIIYFTAVVTLVSVSLALIASPILAYVFNLPVGTYIDGDVIWQLPEYLTPLFAFVGIGLGTTTLHISRWVGRIHGKFAKALLVSD